MLVGRSVETAAIGELLAGARAGRSGVLVLRGEAGIGKSALLEEAARRAEGFTVLRGAGVESESELAYAALHQILRPVLDRIERLPEPQAAALRAAFALSGEAVDERFRVSVGVLGLLSEVAEERPLLCLVDDAQWLDQASADALGFVSRRLEAESLVLLFASREDDERFFAARGLPVLVVTRLGVDESRALLTERLATAVASGVFEWLIDSAGGNPLALVELPETLTVHQLAGQDPLEGRLPPATSVERVYLDRVTALPEPARRLLLLAAAEETGARATVERAGATLDVDFGELTAAETAGLVRVDADRIVFRHPLVRSAVYRGAPFTERELAHRALAEASDAEGSPDRAAWHRAAATVGVDEDVAAQLESTAERARLRGGHAAAAAALQRAAELSPETASAARRLVQAATAAWQAGQPERATKLLDRASPILQDPPLRADLDHIRGAIQWRCGSVQEACAILVAGAAEIAPIDPDKSVDMLADAGLAAWDHGDYGRLAEVGAAMAALPRSGIPEHALLQDVLIGAVQLSRAEARADRARVAEALTRAGSYEEPRLLVWAAIAAEVAGEDALEAALLARSVALARSSGAVDRLTVALESIAVQGFLGGNYGIVGEATEGLTLAREAALPNAANLHLASLAWIDAVRGRDEECRARAAEVVETARPNGHGIANSIAEWAIGLLDLGQGRTEEAVTRLRALAAAPPGASHPFYIADSAPDLMEACVRTGRRDAAVSAFAPLEEFAGPKAPTWALAIAARCRAMLAEGGAAEEHFQEALQLHGQTTNPFDKARTQLLYGEFLRREKRRAEAREQLRPALAAFESLGAVPWEDRTRTELRATGETARKRDASTLADLTPQELQIARLVGEGGSNKEIAAQLFLSPRTVEYHLRKVFAKLGIASRAELIKQSADLGERAVA
jgi:DNA-binding CsgD family transcriptional regulator